MDKLKIKKHVRDSYAKIAKSPNACGCSNSSCCEGEESLDIKAMSQQLGYGITEIDSVPAGSNMGLGCGNPHAFANIKKGETILDLGSGGGFDCFIAARVLNGTGKVIGVDMTPEMVEKARYNAEAGKYLNVEFRLGEIEHLPVADNTVDVIISNCVINLSTDKQQVFNDAFRVLKNGGRVAISDVVKTATLPLEVEKEMDAFSACVSGASTILEVEAFLLNAGFQNIKIYPKDESREFIKNWIPSTSVENYIQSAVIEAQKL